MSNEEYMEMLKVFHVHIGEMLIVSWSNDLKVKCFSFTGYSETSLEPGDEGYVGEYTAGVTDVEIIKAGIDNSVEIYENSIDISLACIPNQIMLTDGTILWQRGAQL